MSFHDFISKNIIDLGEAKKPAVPVSPVHSSAKSFINSSHAEDANIPDARYSQPVGYVPPASTYSNSAIANTIASTDLEAARTRIIKLLDDSNQPGLDFHEFVVAKNGMSAIPVEADRYKIAFSSLSPIGLTKEILNKSAVFYISVVDNELKNFQNQFAQVNKSDVADKKISIQTKQDQMKQLSDQINKLNEEIKTMTDEVATSEATLNSKANAFTQAVNEAKGSIQSELDKINQYVQ